MRAIKVIFALFLGVTGIIGCVGTDRLPQRAQVATVPQRLSAPPLATSTVEVVFEESHIYKEETPSNSPAESSNPPPTNTLAAPTPPKVENQAESAAQDSSEIPIERLQDRHETPSPPSAKTQANPTRALPNFKADNRLLELLEKDIDKAVEQPAQHRRLEFSKAVVAHPAVRHFVREYTVTAKKSFEELLARSGKYMPMIAKVLASEGLPKELGYLALLESQFVIDSTSPTGAVGLWQFVAGTARQYGLRIDAWIDERRDPLKSTRAAAAYLKDLHDYYGRWFLATAAYNAGQGNVDKALRRSKAKDFWTIRAKAELSEETRNFVPKFIAIALVASNPEKYGFHDIAYDAPLDYEELELTKPLALDALAELADTDVRTLKSLNPALLRNVTPPGEPGFRVNLPVGRGTTYLARLKERMLEKTDDSVQVVTHEVKRGETLFSIARFYGSTVRTLMELNGLTTSRLRIGQKIGVFFQGIRSFR